MRRKNRSTKMKNELSQSVDHLKRAASIAAQETSATVGPKFYAARDRVQPTAVKAKDAATSSWDSALATLTPLVTAATENARQAGKSGQQTVKANKKAARKNAKKLEKRANKTLGRKQKSRSGAKLGGLLLVGAAVGAAGAYVVRKRRREQWDEYDPATPVSTPVRTGADDAAFEPADLSGPSGFVTPAAEADTLVVDDSADQTSSAQHTPKVAKLASGKNGNV
jgi:hypothetical protein